MMLPLKSFVGHLHTFVRYKVNIDRQKSQLKINHFAYYTTVLIQVFHKTHTSSSISANMHSTQTFSTFTHDRPKSFKFANLEKECKEFPLLKEQLGKWAVNTLLNPFNSDDGIRVAVEKPNYSKFATINVTRKPVLRQFYGKKRPSSDDEDERVVARATYGNNAPYDTTLGRDILDYTVKDFCPELENMASFLSKLLYRHLKEKKNTRKNMIWKNLNFNHASVLYYVQNKQKKESSLNYHTDHKYGRKVEESLPKSQGSQGRKTPSVVLTLGQMRIIHMKQCRMSGRESSESASLDLTDGDVFMLHPEDEMIKTRKFGVNVVGKTVFKHAVVLPKRDDADYLSVGIAFRCIPDNHRDYDRESGLIDYESVKRSESTVHQKKHEKTIEEKRPSKETVNTFEKEYHESLRRLQRTCSDIAQYLN